LPGQTIALARLFHGPCGPGGLFLSVSLAVIIFRHRVIRWDCSFDSWSAPSFSDTLALYYTSRGHVQPFVIRATLAALGTPHAVRALVVSSTVRRYLRTIG